MSENLIYVTTKEFEEFRTEMLGNRKPLFKDDTGRLGKLENRILRIEKILYGAIGVMVFLKFIEPYLSILGAK